MENRSIPSFQHPQTLEPCLIWFYGRESSHLLYGTASFHKHCNLHKGCLSLCILFQTLTYISHLIRLEHVTFLVAKVREVRLEKLPVVFLQHQPENYIYHFPSAHFTYFLQTERVLGTAVFHELRLRLVSTSTKKGRC